MHPGVASLFGFTDTTGQIRTGAGPVPPVGPLRDSRRAVHEKW
jgi:hypothetical protein